MLTIGQLSHMFNISPKTLRHYDSIDLFKPSKIGEKNQYRYYTPDQFTDLRQILLLRSLGIGLEVIRQLKSSGALEDFATIKRISEEQASKIKKEIKAQEKLLLEVERTISYMETIGRTFIEPQIVQKKAFTVIGLEWSSQDPARSIPDVWEELLTRLPEIRVPADIKSFYGICISEPGEGFKYAAGATVNEISPPDGMKVFSIPEQTYAVFTHMGPVSYISETMEKIYRYWLPQQGLTPGRMDLELYDDRFLGPENEYSQIDLYVSIQCC
jgi:predicted transcriptional regulator YdeE/DNA-binding transcriptional MerR regulator